MTLYDARVVKLTRLRALRERKVLTQQEYGERAGITRATLSRLGNAENPAVDDPQIILDMGVQPQVLMNPRA